MLVLTVVQSIQSATVPELALILECLDDELNQRGLRLAARLARDAGEAIKAARVGPSVHYDEGGQSGD